jgi:uncharacterized protein with HEPN domain
MRLCGTSRCCVSRLGASLEKPAPGTQQRHPEVDWRAIAGMRNVLVHNYLEIDLDVVWSVIEGDLDALESAVRELLAGSPSDS